MQKTSTFLGFEVSSEPTETIIVSIDASRITKMGLSTRDKSNIWYRSDYPKFTVIELVGARAIHVKETPEQIEQIIKRQEN